MHHSTHAPTQSEAQRFAEFQWIGCVVCRLEGEPTFAYDIHHIVKGGRRLGHLYTIPLHPWFHRGLPPDDLSIDEARRKMGPSMAIDPQAFFAKWRDEFWLLNAVNDMIKAKLNGAPRLNGSAKAEQTIHPREWTICGDIAVKTRSLQIAHKAAEQVPAVVSGTVDGYEFLALSEYNKRANT